MLEFQMVFVWFLQLGMHLCVAGWMEGGKVGYPTRFPSVKCGDNHVGLVLYKEPVDQSNQYDAYCYRLRGMVGAESLFILLQCHNFYLWPDHYIFFYIFISSVAPYLQRRSWMKLRTKHFLQPSKSCGLCRSNYKFKFQFSHNKKCWKQFVLVAATENTVG